LYIKNKQCNSEQQHRQKHMSSRHSWLLLEQILQHKFQNKSTTENSADKISKRKNDTEQRLHICTVIRNALYKCTILTYLLNTPSGHPSHRLN